ncbi:MAG: long-chain fatty acid--CoA ligase [Calditerrivibrio sp.]|nr:long-chain fatty acid--CoA ligase [Calditerrivibrio sp.]MCA1980974.1 long-chain fatty acid--CoA ligase [Calditerrivibrio sp.]
MSDKKYGYDTIVEMFKGTVEKYPKNMAFGYKKGDQFVHIPYTRYYELVLMMARGLKKIGIKKGDRIAILSENRPGWIITDMAIQMCGAITVPIYPTNTPETIEYILNNSESRAIFISNKIQFEKLYSIKDNIPTVEYVFSFDRFLSDKKLPVFTFLQISEISIMLTEEEKVMIEKGIEEINPEDVATIIYTSGTTGFPKGVMLTHKNLMSEVYLGTRKIELLTNKEIFLSFLPLSHILERSVGYYIPVYNGCEIVFAENIDKVAQNILEVNPTLMISVPRLFEKIYSRVYENVHAMSPFKKSLFHKAIEFGRWYVHKKHEEKQVDSLSEIKYKFYDKLIFSKIRQRFGTRFKGFVSGGAPLDRNINEFFWAIGVQVYEGYGLTETSPGICINCPSKVKIGSVGTPFEETEFKIAEDGEILVKGPMIMKGYYKNAEATKEAFDGEWFKTGDIGEIRDGFIYIVDRKKELIVTSGGKNISPQHIENELKLDKYISQAYVHGDKKPYLVALLIPNVERLIEFAKEKELNYLDLADLAKHPEIIKLFNERVSLVNSKLAKYETIKRFAIIPTEFTIEGGEITPTLKLRRKNIYKKYESIIECLYSDNNENCR